MADPQYTVFIRVPIPRGDFVDPPQVNWDTSKDNALWKILSGAAQKEIDWNHVADRFDVPVDFLLNKVAYLTEQHASQVRAQVRKATAAAKGSSAPSPVPGVDSAGMSHPRTTSALSIRRDSPMPRPEATTTASPFNPTRPVISRNTSANTAVPRDREAGGASSRQGKPAAGRLAETSGRRRLSSLPMPTATAKSNRSPEPQPERSPSPGPAESSSPSSDSEAESLPVQSRIIRRPPRFQQDGATSPVDDDDESEPAFQPYKAVPDQASGQDLGSTLRGDGHGSKRTYRMGKEPINYSQTSDSSTGSAAMVKRPSATREPRTPGPLSPRRATEVAGRSPSGKSKGYSREGSDGTPSMGSSFSDLDDASVTQSALEEALASHMKAGGGSRFGISQAFRSRYNPSSNQ